MSDYAIDQLSVWAVRYALGRTSYAVNDVVETLLAFRSAVTNRSRLVIVADINVAIRNDAAGMDMDVRAWKRLREALMEPQENVA